MDNEIIWPKPACKYCGRQNVDLSRRLICRDCSIKAMKEAVTQLKAHRGPRWERWKRRRWPDKDIK